MLSHEEIETSSFTEQEKIGAEQLLKTYERAAAGAEEALKEAAGDYSATRARLFELHRAIEYGLPSKPANGTVEAIVLTHIQSIEESHAHSAASNKRIAADILARAEWLGVGEGCFDPKPSLRDIIAADGYVDRLPDYWEVGDDLDHVWEFAQKAINWRIHDLIEQGKTISESVKATAAE